jgi:hypothetical protein
LVVLKNFWTTQIKVSEKIFIYNERLYIKEVCLMRTDILESKDEILQWIAEEQPKCYMC